MTDTPDPTPPETSGEPVSEPLPPQAAKGGLLPWLSAAGFLVLAAALVWVWRHPGGPPPLPEHGEAQMEQLAALDARISRMEQRPVPPPVELGPLTARVAALEQRPATTSTAPAGPVPDLAPLTARVTALEQRPATTSATPAGPVPDLAPLTGRVAALEQRRAPDLGPIETRIAALEAKQPNDSHVAGRIDALGARVDTLDASRKAAQSDIAHHLDADEARLASVEHDAGQLPVLAERASRTARILAVQLALDAGQKLGDMPGAPPALARFADTAPPTEAALRLAFPRAAHEAMAAARPPGDGKPLLARVWAEAQDLVTIRQGDRVLVGDPTAGVLERARTALDAGDLAGAVAAAGSLNGDAAQAMAGWLAQARALLEARAALAEWAAHD